MMWQILFGLGLFLLGMSLLEKALGSLSSRRFRKWLAEKTDTPLSSVTAGTVTTAVLQSSSMVSLLMLALVGASVIPLYNAVGVLLGANLGTTFTGWIVTTVGFKLKVSTMATPMVALGSIFYIFSRSESKLHQLSQLVLGFGLLLYGLGQMKVAVQSVPDMVNIESLKGHGLWVYLLVGVALSAIIQSSSATMMIALSALHAGIIDLQPAAALVIGADLGTTSTTALGALKGHSVKRQLALSHVIFNLVVDVAAFVLLLPFLPALLNLLELSDPLYGLVAFHSLFNFLGLLIFIPFLKRYTDWIGGFFKSKTTEEDLLVTIPAEVTPVGLNAMKEASLKLLKQTMKVNHQVLRVTNHSEFESQQKHYHQLKHFEGRVLIYAQELQKFSLSSIQSKRLTATQEAVRLAVYSAKTLNDTAHDLIDFHQDKLADIEKMIAVSQQEVQHIYSEIDNVLSKLPHSAVMVGLSSHDKTQCVETLLALSNRNQTLRLKNQECIYHVFPQLTSDAMRLSTALNLVQEIWSSNNSLINSVLQLVEME